MGEVERGRGGSAGVLHVEDRCIAEAGAVERGLAADAVLALQRALGGIGEDNRLRRLGRRARRRRALPQRPRVGQLRAAISGKRPKGVMPTPTIKVSLIDYLPRSFRRLTLSYMIVL